MIHLALAVLINAAPSPDVVNKYPLDLGNKCSVGHNREVGKPAVTNTNISVPGLVIPAGSQIYVLSEKCHQGQVYQDGTRANNFLRYSIRYQGRIFEVGGGFSF
jgi:hypothetical protein